MTAHMKRTTMRFSDVDAEARKGMSAAEVGEHDRRRADLAAQLRAGIAFRDAREAAGLTQTELAARIGIAQSALSRIEAGRTNLTLSMFRRFAEALDVDVALEVGTHRVVVAPAA
ncbi:MAG: helix-turn-helix domain-containing protein [Acidimicrobiales bacterium]